MWQHFQVQYRYPVVFGRGLFEPSNSTFAEVMFELGASSKARGLIVVDDGLAAHWPGLQERLAAYVHQRQVLDLVAPAETVVGGESSKKDHAVLERIYRRVYELALDRHAYVVAVGGGAMLDAVGYAVATAHRGLRLVRVPTTVLAQCDSGVGVKTGINAFESKNFLGTFSPPSAVFNDYDFLSTLHPRDKVAGLAESVKVGLIRDRGFFEWMESHADALARFEPRPLEYAIERTAELHLQHISQCGDPFERTSARPLDFGHWIAHKLESLTGHALRHGEAVAIGIAMDAGYSSARGTLPAESAERVWRLLAALGLPLWDEALLLQDAEGRPRFLEGLEEFRQHLGGQLSVTLLPRLGAEQQVGALDEAAVLDQVHRLRAFER